MEFLSLQQEQNAREIKNQFKIYRIKTTTSTAKDKGDVYRNYYKNKQRNKTETLQYRKINKYQKLNFQIQLSTGP